MGLQMNYKVVSMLLIVVIMSINKSFAAEVDFVGDLTQETTTGYSLLKWKLHENATEMQKQFVLQQSNSPQFNNAKTIYKGPDMASFVSGLPNGDYFYRVGINKDGGVTNWSKGLHLEVKHHSRNLAMLLFFLGTIIFISTVAVIIVGNRKYNN